MGQLLIGIGCILAICFLLPVFTGRIWNPGNMAGLLCAFLFLLPGVFETVSKGFLLDCLSTIWSSMPGKVLVSVSAVVIATGIVIAFVATVRILNYALFHSVKQCGMGCVVIVLGCRVGSRMLDQRLKTACRFLNKHSQASCIVSGGKGADEPESEASFMADYLIGHGIGANRIIQEGRSRTTEENLRYSGRILKVLMEEEEQEEKEIVLVTHGFHAYRAHRTAKRYGMETRLLTVGTPLWLLPTFYMRELLSIVRDWIFRRNVDVK